MDPGQNVKAWSTAKWLGSRARRPDGAWVVDRLESERWIEVGRYGSKHEAEADAARRAAGSTGDAPTFRVTRRPRGPEASRGFVWAVAVGIAVSAIVLVLLVVTRS